MIAVSAAHRAEVLNAAFAEQCSAPPTDSLPHHPGSSPSQFKFELISEDSVAKALRNLPTRKAPGLDDLPAYLLRECAVELSSPLCHIFNLSLSSGVFPSEWKTARIQPVFKNKGDRCDPLCYRPIALLPTISKVLEQFVHRQLLSYSMSNNFIPDEQFGFVPGRSTVWQLLSVLDEWHTALDSGTSVHALFLDVSKAFDRVDHDVLLHKLRSMGLSDSPLKWMSSYLRGRSICTSVEKVLSSLRKISSGVPQGSVLGPLLFVLYVSDLPRSVSTSSCVLFADDSLLYNNRCSGSSSPAACSRPCCNLQVDADSVQSWADNWNSTFNAKKSCHMVISRSSSASQSPPISLHGVSVPSAKVTRHLGLVITCDLKWSSHVSRLLTGVSWKVALLKRLLFRCYLPLSVFSYLYTVLLRPCLEYASVVWDNCSSSDTHSLERIQLSLARSAASLHHFSAFNFSKSCLLQLLGWPTLAWRRRRSKLLHFWHLVQRRGPPGLCNKLLSVSSRCSYSLRNLSSFEVPACSSSSHLSSFLPSCIILWNSLPAPITSCTSLSSFASSIDSHFAGDKFSFGLPP